MLAFNLALLIAPPVVLAFAGPAIPLAPWAPPFALLLSLLTLALVLLLTRTWRAFFLWHLPLLGAAPAFIAYVLKFDAPPGEGAFAVALTSSWHEAWSFADAFGLQPWLIAWCAALLLYLVLSLALGKLALPARLKRAVVWAALPLLAASLLMPTRSGQGLVLDVGENLSAYLTLSYPFGGAISLVGGLEGNAEAWGFFKARPPFGARQLSAQDGAETHILVIGESARADHFHLLGYERQTTPHLEKVDGLISYGHMFSTGNLTMLAVPMLMTGTAPRHYSPEGYGGNLIDLAKEAGYSTALITNQELWIYKLFHPRPDVWRQASDAVTLGDLQAIPDDLMLPPLDALLRAKPARKFIVMHTYGSHWDYSQRLPDNGFVFTGMGREAVRQALKQNAAKQFYTDLYDDTILHTDALLGEIIERASRLPGKVTVTYIPDHGEALPLSENASTHGFAQFHVSELRVPLLLWANAEFKTAHAAQWQALQVHRDEVSTQDDVFYTMASLMGIGFPGQDEARDLSSPQYRPQRLEDLRFVIGPNRDLRGLKDAQDWRKACAQLQACN
jgi:glucan phosphoethanolaminetransferase (alkaline phosphatase superfamily)